MATFETVDPVDPSAVELDMQAGTVSLVVDPTGADDGGVCWLLRVDWDFPGMDPVYLPASLMPDQPVDIDG